MAISERPSRHTTERTAVAAQLRKIRAFERELTPEKRHASSWNRDILAYIEQIGGISAILAHAKRLNSGGVVLDIGSGGNLAMTELITKTKIAQGLDFIATNLSRVPHVAPPAEQLRIVRTPAETLRGIDDESVSAALAVASIAYSKAPKMVASSVDRVLVPGGVIKAQFRPLGSESDFSERMGYGTHHEFSAAFQELGYDIAVREGTHKDLMVALKPGGNPEPFNKWWPDLRHSAADLMGIDMAYADQLAFQEGKL